ncbi:MAG: T9SS type A sorting domain-containing protein, partial [Ignavibacteria bacterium]|nr:T9SS type A sorting domain-containing protein [Ignavibacteria bacterium]
GVWYYRLKQIDLDGIVHYSDGILVDVLTDVEESPFPTAYFLDQNYPNPFNPSTTIEFALPMAGYVSLKVYNVIGKEVATLVSRELPAGRYGAHLDAADLPSGTYFYRLQAGDFVGTKKLLLLR